MMQCECDNWGSLPVKASYVYRMIINPVTWHKISDQSDEFNQNYCQSAQMLSIFVIIVKAIP